MNDFFSAYTFRFPEGVALSVGGPGAREHIVIEMHYDNPKLHSGTICSPIASLQFLQLALIHDHLLQMAVI